MKHMMNGPIAKANYDLFPEIATTLLYFTVRLYDALVEQGVRQVYFLSREGHPLKRMFDLYQNRVSGDITSHYLEVSRRSTLLPSLEPLAEEGFETLFRQYRRISLFEFLSSLGLEARMHGIALALGLPEGAEVTREEDFPTSQTFIALKALPLFQDLYESERVARRRAFIAYLSELSGGTPPDRLAIVDVGWKGTIQDNLFALLCRKGDTPVRAVTGYYVGLVAAGAASPRNDKFGLLFSSVGEISPKFRIFNENRALFEVVLAADHGSIVTYEIASDGRPKAIRGEFEEGEMLAREVFPVQRQVFEHFERLLEATPLSVKGRALPFAEVVRAHARMVFNPTIRERAWFSSVFHVENYGVFERSRFASPESRPRLIQRLRFLKQVLLRRDVGTLGFWPWSTLHERGGALPAAIYAAIRRLQS
ncbi:hypothetical protein [Laribacter hongkongensis]|uniref:hypothetical protein n=1 Tax=Laribacter hongkongensis TaxID=168471 RepID=UPI001EFDDEBD|nr:hypothetical protein [Laribacter hongkongensis]MCG9032996.1 hypothetical protein [Laribacter hongkongensis]MCG9093082.1 hypothetical protein [Laribacter hongkongensis]